MKRKRKGVAIVWVATSGDRVQHAHSRGWRFCAEVLVADPSRWLVLAQPERRCVQCEAILERALLSP